MAKARIGPVIQKDELEYFREVNLLEDIKCRLMLAGSSEDMSRFKIRNEFYRMDGKLAARVTSTGGWMDLNSRKLIAPPEKLKIIVGSLTKTEDFIELASSIK